METIDDLAQRAHRRHPSLRATLLSALLLGARRVRPGSGRDAARIGRVHGRGRVEPVGIRRRHPPSASPSAGPARPVRLALDWTPNTNHTGFFVAQAKDWYATPAWSSRCCRTRARRPETLVAAGQAECGISFQDAMTFAAAAGAPLVSVMAILQHTAQEIAVLAVVAITAAARPRRQDVRRVRLSERGADAARP